MYLISGIKWIWDAGNGRFQSEDGTMFRNWQDWQRIYAQ